jgi:hypothetical protein
MAKLEGEMETREKDLENLLRTADQCLYMAKNNGGDQVCAADDTRLANPPLSTSSIKSH